MAERSALVSPASSSMASTLSGEVFTTSTSVSVSSPLKIGMMRNLSLREVWEIYIKAVKSQDQSADNVKRQSQLLKLLLHLCIEELDRGDLTEFSELKSVCNQLCKEFMSDILHITSKSEEDDYTELQRYLLTDRGWLLLQVIYKKGVKNVSSGRDFATLLASLLPWCLKFPLTASTDSDQEEVQDVDLPSISHTFQNILKTSHAKCTQLRHQAVPATRHTHKSPSDLGGKHGSDTSSGKRKYSKRKSVDLNISNDESDPESGENVDVKHRGKHKRKCRYYNIHSLADRKTQKTDSDTDDDDLNVLLKNVPLEDRSISGYRLCVLILGLLYDLSLSDLSEKSPGKPISTSLLPFLLQCLNDVEKSSGQSVTDGADRNVGIYIQRHVLRVVYSCCGVIAVQLNGLNILIGYKIVEQILDVLNKVNLNRIEGQSDAEFYRRLGREFDLIFDAIVGLVLSLTVAFENLPFNLTAIKSAMNLMQIFDEHKGFQLMRECILYNDWMKSESADSSQNSLLSDNEPVKVFGTFLSTLKVVRVNYIHSMKCVKRKHQKCMYVQYFDHHHDILGGPSRITHYETSDVLSQGSKASIGSMKHSSSPQPTDKPQPVCLVSSCTDFLLDLLVKVVSKVTRLDILKTIYTSGICCCMNLEHIVQAFKEAITKFSPAVRTFALDTLSKVILEHFSGGAVFNSKDTEVSTCTICDVSAWKLDKEALKTFTFHEQEKSKWTTRKSKGFDSGIDSSDTTQDTKLSAFYRISKWKSVGKLRSLLYLNNDTLATTVAKHLMVLAIKGNGYLKAELFFNVYYHTLDSVKKGCNQEGTKGQSLSKPVQVHCLSALPFLLQSNCVTKAFLSSNGVRKLCDLLEDEVLRPPVLRIFEALVVLDEQKLDVSQTVPDICPCPYRGGQVIDAFISELSKRSFDKDGFDDITKPKTGRIRRDSVVLSKFSLPVLVDLWKTCAKLCLSSRVFVRQFQDQQYFRKTESLLLETLDILVSPNVVGFIYSQGSTETEDSGMEAETVSTGSEFDLGQDSSGFFMRISLLESLIVVLGGCQKYMAIKGQSTIHTWEKIKKRFKEGLKLEPTKLKVLMDAIMNACMPQYFSILEFSYSRNIALVYMRDDDIYDEDEVRQLLQTGSDEEREITTEIGYDADSESTYHDEDDKDQPEMFVKCYAPQKVYFPSVFRLLFEMLVQLQSTDHCTGVVSSILHKLIQYVRADVNIVKAMAEQDVLSVIMNKAGFWDSLVKKETETIVKDSLLVLIQYLGQHKMEAPEFQKILQLFQHSTIPMERLLLMLQTIVENSHIKANHMVTFPVKSKPLLKEEDEESLLEESGSYEAPQKSVHPFMRSVSNLVPAVNSLFMAGGNKTPPSPDGYGLKAKYRKNVQDVWKVCAINHRLRDTITWPPFQNGFTVALWMCLDKGVKQYFTMNTSMYDIGEEDVDKNETPTSTVSKCIHMVSIGTREKLLEIWVDTETSSLIFRMTSEISDLGLVLRETSLTGVMTPSRWQHVVMSYVEGLDGSTITGKVSLVIDGWQTHSFILDYPFSAVKSRHKSASRPQPLLCLGHAVEDLTLCMNGQLSLGTLSLIKGAHVPKEICFHLFTLGPNAGSLLKSDCSEEMSMYAPYLHRNTVLHSKIQYDALVGLRKPDLTHIRSSLILTYDPQTPEEISVFPPLTRHSQGQVQGQIAYTPDSLLSQQPRTISPQCQGHVVTRVESSLEKAVYMSGGMSAILFLVAKVYERCPEDTISVESEKVQSEALRLLFSVIHHSASLEQEYVSNGGHALLGKVLTSCRSVIGKQILKVLMDAATTESLFKFTSTSKEMSIRAKSDAIIRDVSVIEQLILQWQIWGEYGQEDILGLLFSALANLVREDHPHQTFNVKQYQAINLINKIFKIYQERIQDGFPALPVHVGASVVSIVHCMTGSPPDYHLILDICDFLLLAHPAANTYINHSKTAFYFNLSWGLPPSPLTQWKKGLGHDYTTSTPIKPVKSGSDKETKKGKENLTKAFDSMPSQDTKEIPVKALGFEREQSGLIAIEKSVSLPLAEEKLDTARETSVVTTAVTEFDKTGVKNTAVTDKANIANTAVEKLDTAGVANTALTKSDKAVLEGGDEATVDRHTTDKLPVDTLHTGDSTINTHQAFQLIVDSPDGAINPEKVEGANNGPDFTEFGEVDRDQIIAEFVNHAEKSPSLPGGFECLYKKSEFDKVAEIGDGLDNDLFEDEHVGGDRSSSEETSEDGVELTVKERRVLSLKFDEDNVELLKQEEGLTALCVGLLKLLAETIQLMPDSLVEKTFTRSIINPSIFIVLAQNSSSEVREVVINVISSYLNRCDAHHLEAFLKMEGFQLLSAQIYQYPTHQEQMEAALSILMLRSFKMHEDFQLEEPMDELSRIQQSAITLIVALLGNSSGDLALCHNSLQFCCRLFKAYDIIATVMVEQGIVEVMCNMLRSLLEDGSRDTDIEGMDENEILLNDLLDFFKVIAEREFSASGPQHYQRFEDILIILQEMEKKEADMSGIRSKGVQTFRVFQHHILMSVIESVRKASEEISSQSFSFFSKSIPKAAPATYEPSTSLLNSTQPYAHRSLPSSQQPLSLSGTFGHNPFRKKSPGGYFVKADQPFMEMYMQASSGGESDSSQDSLLKSARTVNFPLMKRGHSQLNKSLDISQGRLVRSNSLLQTVFSIGKRKKLATIRVSQKELIDRLVKVIAMSVDTAILSEKPRNEKKTHMLFESASHAVTMEREYFKKLFTFLYRGFETTLPPDKKEYKRNKNVIMWGAKDVLRVQLGRLLCYSLSARQEFELRIYTLSYIMGEERGKEILKMLLNTQDLGNDLAYFVRDLLIEGKKWMSKQQAEDGARLLNLLSSEGYQVISPRSEGNQEQAEILIDRKRLIDLRFAAHKTAWLKKKDISLNRIFHQYDSLSSRLSDNAMEVTQFVTHLQHQERIKFITHIKHKRTQSIQVKKQWQEIVQNLTHERAIWFDETSYPRTWQLNPTEGPGRVRKRLQRGHLQILPKFLKREFQNKLVSETVDPPLIYLFEDDHQMSDSAALIYQLHKNKKIRYTCSCRAVSPNSESKGELLIGEDSVFFVADEAISDANYTQVLLGNKDQLSMTWPFEDVLEIHKRWYELSDTALEIFLTNGKTCLLALKTTKERDDLHQHLMMLELPNQRELCRLIDTMIKWQEKSITNFEYLTQLNKLAGRSFNDLMQYPIMPFILSDYTSDSIDLRDETIYRNLQKPVSVQDPKHEQKFKTNYMILKQEFDKFGKGEMTGMRVEPYHYGSHYSNSGSVLHYLVRLPPFTKMFLNFQDQSFDIPDRTFHNLHTSWRLSSAESNTDVKELIPEFFFSHEFLTNSEGFDFGKRQTDDVVNDIVLPPWCDGNPRLFILIHRQALESDHVTEYIPEWIDLVFGYKQRGVAAVKAVNVFHPATYFGLDVTSVRNPVDRKAIQTMVRTYGQTPKQLFTTVHPKNKHESRHDYQRNPQQVLDGRVRNVMGLKWGSYLGSLDKPAPVVSWEWNETNERSQVVASLIPLPTGEVFGIGIRSCLLMTHSQDKPKVSTDYTIPDVVWAAIVTWSETDGLIRIINNVNKPPVNLINHSQADQIRCCVSMPDCRYLFVGGLSGVITIYNTKHNLAKESQIQVFGPRRYLYGHTDAINCLEVCKPYSILVSGSRDGTCIIWDLNRLSYVRTVKGHEASVQVIAISETLGDIASVSHHGMGSYLFLHTVNAEFVTLATCEETINCLTYSNAPEGKSINVVAGGLSSGKIRMWSSWDLSPVRDLSYNSLIATPIVSLTFTKDSQRLYCSSADGRVLTWDYSGQPKLKNKFIPHLFDV